jgi:hypothetical protein
MRTRYSWHERDARASGSVSGYERDARASGSIQLCSRQLEIICVIKMCAGLFDAVFDFAAIKDKDSRKFDF